jgi:hypothetical protein
VDGRYLVLLYYNTRSIGKKRNIQDAQEQLEHKKKLYGVKTRIDEVRQAQEDEARKARAEGRL